MDFEFYRNFITVAETGNLTTASKKTGPGPAGPQRPDQNAGALLRRQADPDCARQTPADPDRSRGSLPGQGPPDLPHRRNHPFRYAELQ